jgi:hypothetical protein
VLIENSNENKNEKINLVKLSSDNFDEICQKENVIEQPSNIKIKPLAFIKKIYKIILFYKFWKNKKTSHNRLYRLAPSGLGLRKKLVGLTLFVGLFSPHRSWYALNSSHIRIIAPSR